MNTAHVARALTTIRQLGSWWRITLSRATGARVDRGCDFATGVDAQLGIAAAHSGHLAIGEYCTLAQQVVLHPYGGSIAIGSHVFLGPGAVIYGHGGVTIGQDTLISMHCRILSSNHTVPPPGTIIRSKSDELLPTHIGRDVWLGAGVTVLGGVTIGDGCVVGAGAVVTRDLPPQSIAFGVPAIVRAYRA